MSKQLPEGVIEFQRQLSHAMHAICPTTRKTASEIVEEYLNSDRMTGPLQLTPEEEKTSVKNLCNALLGGKQPLLTERETEILQRIADDYSTKEIAEELCMSPRTVEAHRQKIKDKLQTNTAGGLIATALRLGLID